MIRANFKGSALLESVEKALSEFEQARIAAPFDKYYRVCTAEEVAEAEGVSVEEFEEREKDSAIYDVVPVLGYAFARDEYIDQISDASGLIYCYIGPNGKLYYTVSDRVFELELSDLGVEDLEEDEEVKPSREAAVLYLMKEFKYITREQAEKFVSDLENTIKDQNRRTRAEQNKEELEKEYKKLHGDDWSHWEEFTASKMDEAENTSSIYIDLREIISYAEKYISNELKANGGSSCKITTAQDGQYMITLNRSDNSIKAYCDLGYGNASEELDENKSKGGLKEEFIPNSANLHCPECGSSEYYEVDDGEYEDGRCEFHYECKKCGYVSSKDEYYPEDLEENDRDVKVETCTTEETGGNVYVSYGKLSDNTYFAISTDLLMVFDQDRLKASYIIDSKYDGDSSKWESEHLIKSFDYSTPEYKCIAKQIHDMRRNTQ